MAHPGKLGLELEVLQALSWAFCRCCQILSSVSVIESEFVFSTRSVLAQSNLIEAGS